MDNQELKKQVHAYWNQASCGTEFIKQPKFSPAYFAAIEQFRYTIEPEIFSFAQFTRYHGKKILEVGVGAGTDFVQWVRAGTLAHGIDFTEEAITHVHERLALEGRKAEELKIADAEQLPYHDNQFDLVYSWGVIHHAPRMEQCLNEMIRVTKPNGTIKFMVYHRRSLFAFYQYLRHGLMKGKPFQSFASILLKHQESPGTKAYTHAEMQGLLATLPVTIISKKTPVTSHDLLYYKTKHPVIQKVASLIASMFGWQRCGWFMMIELKKKNISCL